MYIYLIKPLIDFIGALLLLILFSPLFLVTALSIFFKLGSPVLFKQQRPGKNEKIFTIYKFRTMNTKTDTHGILLPDKLRLKSFGQQIRSLSLDELPQLFNILKGEMSFIGPRPLLIEYLPLYSIKQKKRHNVKPGITGWAQINGRNSISWKEKFEFDSFYADNISFFLDFKIIYLTMIKVFNRDGISSSSHVTTEKFNGNS